MICGPNTTPTSPANMPDATDSMWNAIRDLTALFVAACATLLSLLQHLERRHSQRIDRLADWSLDRRGNEYFLRSENSQLRLESAEISVLCEWGSYDNPLRRKGLG